MHWIEESRRNAFDRGERARAKERAGSPGSDEIVGDLDLALPEEVRQRGVAIGSELILAFDDALAAIGIATDTEIAILGFDAGEVLEDGFQILDYTGYDTDVSFTGDWRDYVKAMNAEAGRWISEHRLGKNHGYILTSASKREFEGLKR